MWEYFWKSFAILFIAIGPIENAAVYAGLAHDYTKKELKMMAIRACLVAGLVLIFFSVGGNFVLNVIELQLYALQIGGGVLLMILAVKTVMDEYSAGGGATAHHSHRDLSVFPLAMPLIAGPAAITQSTLLVGAVKGQMEKQIAVLVALFVLMVFSYVLLRVAGWVTRLLGAKGAEMLTRVLGILLAALAADLIVKGLAGSGLL